MESIPYKFKIPEGLQNANAHENIDKLIEKIENKPHIFATRSGFNFGDKGINIGTNIFDMLQYGDKPGFSFGTKLDNDWRLEFLKNMYMPEFKRRGMQDFDEAPVPSTTTPSALP